MMKISAIFKASRQPLLTGILIGTSYVPFPPWAALFCYVPLFLWLIEPTRTRKQAFAGAWLSQFILSLIGFHWIAYTAFAYGGFPMWLSGLTLIAFAALIHLHLPLAAVLARALILRFRLSVGRSLFLLAILFSLAERAWPMIFPWHLGYTLLWAKLPLAQWGDTIGFEGLSSLIFFANAWIALMWRRRADRAFWRPQAAIFAGLIVLLMAGGAWKKAAWSETDATLNVLAVQANIGDLEKVYAEQGRGYQSYITQKFVTLSQQGVAEHPETELIVWPETALPDYPDRPERARKYTDLIASGLTSTGKTLLIGAYSKDAALRPGASEAMLYNSMYLMSSDARVLAGPYRKTMLLAFGEYLPLSEQFPFLLKLLPFIANFGRGPGPTVYPWTKPDGATVNLGVQICYEGLFPDFSRGLADKGAQVIFNVTNDSWFGVPFEPRQHMIMTMARAVEMRRPLVRSTNTGITTAMLANGDLLETSPNYKEWTGLFKIDYKKNPDSTLFARGGHFDWIVLLIAGLWLIATAKGPGIAGTAGGVRARTASSGLERGS